MKVREDIEFSILSAHLAEESKKDVFLVAVFVVGLKFSSTFCVKGLSFLCNIFYIYV